MVAEARVEYFYLQYLDGSLYNKNKQASQETILLPKSSRKSEIAI